MEHSDVSRHNDDPRPHPTTSIVHGSSVNVNIAVAPGSGTGVPTGDVSLLNDDSLISGVGEFFTLSGGSISSTTNSLRGGNYHVRAHYAGDGTFAPSDSAPIAITISPEASRPVFPSSVSTALVWSRLVPKCTGTPDIFAQMFGVPQETEYLRAV